MRQTIGIGTPRGLQGRVVAVIGALLALIAAMQGRSAAGGRVHRRLAAIRAALASSAMHIVKSSRTVTYTTGCWDIVRQLFDRIAFEIGRAVLSAGLFFCLLRVIPKGWQELPTCLSSFRICPSAGV